MKALRSFETSRRVKMAAVVRASSSLLHNFGVKAVTGQGACIPGRWQELIEWLKRVVHPAIKTSPGALAAQVMRAQSAVHVGTKIDREQSSSGPVVAGGGW